MELSFLNILLILSFIKYSVQRSLTTPGDDRPPRGCDWVMSGAELEQVVLSCRLRTIGGVDMLLNNLTMLQIDRLTALKLSCSDVLFFESSLDPTRHHGVFLSPLHRLRSLNIEYCKIRHIPQGVLSTLRELRSLVLRSHNSDWSAMSLELHPESFRGLSELRNLDLGDNNIWSLPQRLFCPLYSLVGLNLTENKLQDVKNLGFMEEGCNAVLEVLDLSFNDVIVLIDNGFSGLRALRSLMLQDNAISTVGDRAFYGLNELRTVNLSSNSIVALPPELFQVSKLLREIYLNNNLLSVLAPGLFDGLQHLEILELSHNDLTSKLINRDTFTGLVRLIELNLSFNKITKIDSAVFRDLYSLQNLNLEFNQIEYLSNEGAFSEMKNLHTLTLTNNKLHSIEAKHFTGLYVLRMLYLDSNRIEHIHENAFENFTDLHDLVLNNNHLQTVPKAIQKLRMLKSLDLGNNKIEVVSNESFYGLDKLYGLRLVDNLITNITRDTFSPLRTLEVLNIASNRIAHVEQSAFAANSILKAIRLDGNQLTDISGVFTSLHSLVWLNVSDNHLLWFDFSHLPKNLEWLDMHNNEIPILGNYYEVSNSLKIKMLDASFNKLTKIDKLSIPDSVETILLNNNKIKSVSVGTFINKNQLDKVILYGNEIENMDLASIALTEVEADKELPEFYIGGNPFYCDCNMEWLHRINQLSQRLRTYPRVLDIDSIECTLPHSRGAPPQKLTDLKITQFLCKYETHCYHTCHCCEFDACDCEMTCPDNCTCFYDVTWSSNVVDCSNAGYTQVPEHIPMDATEIYLDGNDLGELGSHVFIGKKKLQILYLNNSNILTLHNRTFNGVTSLRVLHMENNKLDELRGYEFDQLENLNELYLEQNTIETVGNTTFKNLPKLEILKLDDNKIINMGPLATAKTNIQISFNGNLYNCDCQSISKLTDWLRDRMDKLFCISSDETVADAIRRCELHQENAIATSVIQREITLDPKRLTNSNCIPLIAATLVALIVVCLFLSVAYVFRQDVRLWVHSRYGIRLCGYYSKTIDEEEDKDRLYDGYVVYSLRDDDTVSRIIATELEQAGYTLMLHHRDLHLVPGASYVADSVLSAGDASRRIILVISPAFLTYEWSKPELRAALLASLRGPRRRYKLLCILLDSTLPPTPDPEMRALLNAASPIVWNDRRFWEKLRYAMPDVNATSPRKSEAGPELRCKMGLNPAGARYTAAPTALDAWYRFNITAVQQVATPAVHMASTPTPTQSTYVSGDEQEGGSSAGSSQHYECPEHGYKALPTHHVYSTIPDIRGPPSQPPPLPPAAHQSRTYFV